MTSERAQLTAPAPIDTNEYQHRPLVIYTAWEWVKLPTWLFKSSNRERQPSDFGVSGPFAPQAAVRLARSDYISSCGANAPCAIIYGIGVCADTPRGGGMGSPVRATAII